MPGTVQVIPLCHVISISLVDPFLDQDLFSPKLLYAILAIILTCCMSLCVRSNMVNRDGYPIPPGPLRRFAFLGKYPERALHAWAQKFGPIFSLFVGDQLFIVISDSQIAHDLFVKNGKIFSSRKEYFIKNQTVFRGRGVTSTPYGDTWQVDTLFMIECKLIGIRRNHRKIVMQRLNPEAVEARIPNLDYEATNLVQSLFLDTRGGVLPINPSHYAERFVLKSVSTSGPRRA